MCVYCVYCAYDCKFDSVEILSRIVKSVSTCMFKMFNGWCLVQQLTGHHDLTTQQHFTQLVILTFDFGCKFGRMTQKSVLYRVYYVCCHHGPDIAFQRWNLSNLIIQPDLVKSGAFCNCLWCSRFNCEMKPVKSLWFISLPFEADQMSLPLFGITVWLQNKLQFTANRWTPPCVSTCHSSSDTQVTWDNTSGLPGWTDCAILSAAIFVSMVTFKISRFNIMRNVDE